MTWLKSMADWFRAEGCEVKEWDGWKDRSARHGEFSNLMGVINHHTASNPPHGDRDWQYATFKSDAAPEYNVGINPDGLVNVLAAGGVNSSGRGGPVKLSTGTVPQGGANYRLIAVCWANTGTGSETYPAAMVDAGVRVNAALLRRNGWDTGAITCHKEWCGPGTSSPGRKVDPFGPWEQGGDWGLGQGRIDAFRGLVFDYLCDPGGFLMALSDADQRWILDRLRGCTPGPESGHAAAPGARTFLMDDQDGAEIMRRLDRLADRLDKIEAKLP